MTHTFDFDVPYHKAASSATLEGLPPNVMRAVREVNYVTASRFSSVTFANGYEVPHRGDQALFIAACIMVYDLPEK